CGPPVRQKRYLALCRITTLLPVVCWASRIGTRTCASLTRHHQLSASLSHFLSMLFWPVPFAKWMCLTSTRQHHHQAEYHSVLFSSARFSSSFIICQWQPHSLCVKHRRSSKPRGTPVSRCTSFELGIHHILHSLDHVGSSWHTAL